MNLFKLLFGGGANVLRDTVEVFRPNAEASAARAFDLDAAALAQLSAEFHQRQARTWFDVLVDGLNRLPRPLMVITVFGLLIWTAIDPIRMAEVFTAWAIIPAGLWAIIGVIVSFFFGGRAQIKSHDFQREFAATLAAAPQVAANLRAVQSLRDEDGKEDMAEPVASNPALQDWRAESDRGAA
jgi:hypothetical protein